MKIAYVAEWDTSHGSGVLKKIAAQIRAWQQMGHTVQLFALSPRPALWAELHDLAVDVVVSPRIRTSLLRAGLVVERVLAWQPDAVYLRFYLAYPALWRLAEKLPTFLELNTEDVAEFRLTHPPYVYLYHRLTRDRLIERARGLVSVSHEIASHFRRYAKPLVVIGNSIDLTQYAPAPAPANATPHLVFLGDDRMIWQGVDKIIALAHALPTWRFHLLGNFSPATRQRAPAAAVIHGYLPRAAYEPILSQADAALGTLALYRSQMQETSPIKLREYLAYGLPVIIGYRDTDFLEGAPFLLQLPNAPGDLASYRETIAQFVAAWRGRRVPRRAIAHLDVRQKEQQRLAFLLAQSLHEQTGPRQTEA